MKRTDVASSLKISNQKPRVNFHLCILIFESTKEYGCKYFKTSNAQGYSDVVNHAYVIVEISVEFGAC